MSSTKATYLLHQENNTNKEMLSRATLGLYIKLTIISLLNSDIMKSHSGKHGSRIPEGIRHNSLASSQFPKYFDFPHGGVIFDRPEFLERFLCFIFADVVQNGV